MSGRRARSRAPSEDRRTAAAGGGEAAAAGPAALAVAGPAPVTAAVLVPAALVESASRRGSLSSSDDSQGAAARAESRLIRRLRRAEAQALADVRALYEERLKRQAAEAELQRLRTEVALQERLREAERLAEERGAALARLAATAGGAVPTSPATALGATMPATAAGERASPGAGSPEPARAVPTPVAPPTSAPAAESAVESVSPPGRVTATPAIAASRPSGDVRVSGGARTLTFSPAGSGRSRPTASSPAGEARPPAGGAGAPPDEDPLAGVFAGRNGVGALTLSGVELDVVRDLCLVLHFPVNPRGLRVAPEEHDDWYRDDARKQFKVAWRLLKELKLEGLTAREMMKFLRGVFTFIVGNGVLPATNDLVRAMAAVGPALLCVDGYAEALKLESVDERAPTILACLLRHVYKLNEGVEPSLDGIAYEAPSADSLLVGHIKKVFVEARERFLFVRVDGLSRHDRAQQLLKTFPPAVCSVVSDTLHRQRPMAWGVKELEAELLAYMGRTTPPAMEATRFLALWGIGSRRAAVPKPPSAAPALLASAPVPEVLLAGGDDYYDAGGNGVEYAGAGGVGEVVVDADAVGDDGAEWPEVDVESALDGAFSATMGPATGEFTAGSGEAEATGDGTEPTPAVLVTAGGHGGGSSGSPPPQRYNGGAANRPASGGSAHAPPRGPPSGLPHRPQWKPPGTPDRARAPPPTAAASAGAVRYRSHGLPRSAAPPFSGGAARGAAPVAADQCRLCYGHGHFVKECPHALAIQKARRENSALGQRL